jgi:hypothetical protein
MDMKSLQRLACLAALAFLAMPAFAASGPPDVLVAGPEVAANLAAVAPVQSQDACVLAIVEDIGACTISLAAVSGPCPTMAVRAIQAAVPADAVATPEYVAACGTPTPAPD